MSIRSQSSQSLRNPTTSCNNPTQCLASFGVQSTNRAGGVGGTLQWGMMGLRRIYGGLPNMISIYELFSEFRRTVNPKNILSKYSLC